VFCGAVKIGEIEFADELQLRKGKIINEKYVNYKDLPHRALGK
jgi:hypothetical protein